MSPRLEPFGRDDADGPDKLPASESVRGFPSYHNCAKPQHRDEEYGHTSVCLHDVAPATGQRMMGILRYALVADPPNTKNLCLPPTLQTSSPPCGFACAVMPSDKALDAGRVLMPKNDLCFINRRVDS